MKYCLRYHPLKDKKYYHEVAELVIDYRPTDRTLKEFLDIFKKQKINMNVSYADFLDNSDFLLAVIKDHAPQSISIVFPYWIEDEMTATAIEICKNNDINFYFAERVSNWEILSLFINELGVSEAFLTTPLAFDLPKVKKIIGEKVAIRIHPNIAQGYGKDDLKKFFVRPEDVDVYEGYVDVFELETEKSNIYYEIYEKDKLWWGALNEIIENFNSPIDNRCIFQVFAGARLKCGKRCLKGSSCDLCSTLGDCAKVLHDNKIIVEKK